MATAFGAFLEQVLGPHGLVVYDSSDPATKPLARDVFVREVSEPGNTARIAARAGEALVAKGYHAQATLADGTVSVFHLNAAARADSRRWQPGATSATTTMTPARSSWKKPTTHPGALQPERPAAAAGAGHGVPDDLLRGRAQRAGVSRPAERGLRALRRADAADVSARHRHAGRFGDAALPDQIRPAADRAARAGRIGAESAARKPAAADRRAVADRGVVADR